MNNFPQVLILAGGLGQRLRPVTEKIPKPLVPVLKKPFLEYFLNMLKEQGIIDVILCIGYMAQKIISYFGNGNRMGMNIKYSVEKEFLGTGGAIKLASKLIERDFFLLNGDSFLLIDYKQLYFNFLNSKKMGMMVLYDNRYPKIEKNNVRVSGDIISDYNKKDETGMEFVDAGVSVFNNEIIKLFPKESKFSFEETIFLQLIRKKMFAYMITDNRYYDIGTIDRLHVFEEYVRSNITKKEVLCRE